MALKEKIGSQFVTPRLWVGAGMLAFVIGLVLAYHDAQVAADHVIAMRETTTTDGASVVMQVNSALGPGTLAPWRRAVNGFGVLCFAAAFLLSATHLMPRRPRRAAVVAQPAARPTSRHRSFAPIVSQDEIAEAEADEQVQALLPPSVARFIKRSQPAAHAIATFRSRR